MKELKKLVARNLFFTFREQYTEGPSMEEEKGCIRVRLKR